MSENTPSAHQLLGPQCWLINYRFPYQMKLVLELMRQTWIRISSCDWANCSATVLNLLVARL